MKRQLAFLLCLATALGASSAAAQSRAGKLKLTPVVGWYFPVLDLGVTAEDGELLPVSLGSSPALGIRVERGLAPSWLGVRGALTLVPDLDLRGRRSAGERSCGSNCVEFLDRNDRLTGSTILLASLDALARAPRLLGTEPYALLGVGLKHYDFDQDALQPALAPTFSDNPTRGTIHVGFGAEVPAERWNLNVEVGDYESRYAGLGSQVQHDGYLSGGVGIRLR